MVERFQVYQLTVPTVPVGGLINVPLLLDSDAPFALRRVKSRNIGLNGWRIKTPELAYQSSQLRTDWNVIRTPFLSNNGPFPTYGVSMYPELIYAANSQIVCDIGNSSGSPITNARLTFFGAKLYQDGAMAAATYPPQFRGPLPFVYPTDVPNVGLATSATAPFIIKELQLQNLFDADYVNWGGVLDARAPVQTEGGPVAQGTQFLNDPGNDPVQPTYTELYVTLRDEAKKPYMNEPIHADDLFGRAFTTPSLQGSSNMPASPNFPGLWTPEIYLQRNCSLYFDLFRFDTLAGGGVPLTLRFRWIGAKVFPA